MADGGNVVAGADKGKSANRDAPADRGKVDGRRARSASSRRKILSAMLALVEEGNPSPTAESIAARAGVSLRTVFRHFEEMDNLHVEIISMVFDRLRPILDRPLEARQWPEILYESIDRRAQFFETLSPFKTAMDVLRHRSRPVATMHRRMAEISRDLLVAVVPARIRADRELFELLILTLSAESWQRRREQQGMDVTAAHAAVRRAAVALLGLSDG